ncbi:MAG: hypothetical protein BJ554DRAFT_4880 [Olpidium bornovanus]|uniref:Uncharacterized protein n=1 Tax=Olpidium bornovanus TaxID=278681 RepID=A0A8H8A0N9_9FUNG|nr:MAG: hypothetical protein BJ554DRAFT_4880 [Olpidium bornovanus]
MLLCFTCTTVYCLTRFHNERKRYVFLEYRGSRARLQELNQLALAQSIFRAVVPVALPYRREHRAAPTARI